MKNKRNRQQEIIHYLERVSFAAIDDFIHKFHASHSTIRRDLDELCESRIIKRIPAGAYYLEKKKKQDEVAESVETAIPFLAEKHRIAAAAVSLIHDGDTIFMDGGTTNLQIANQMTEFRNITVVTNSIDIAYKFKNKKNISMYICGGIMGEARPGNQIVGPLAEKMVSLFRAQICFLGTLGIDPKRGITDPDLSAARMKNIMIENSAKAVMVTDRSKFGKMNAAFVCPAAKFDHIITDKLAPEEDVKDLAAQGINVELV